MDVKLRTKAKNGKHLPYELAEDILLLLPVKDLLRLRIVCKDWKTLIDSSSFKNKHFETAKLSPSTLLFCWRIDCYSPRTINYLSSDGLLPPLSPPLKLGQFVGTFLFSDKFSVVHGLVCFASRTSAVIWNPTTNELRNMDTPENWDNGLIDLDEECGLFTRTYVIDALCALGFDPITQDYKFVYAEIRRISVARAKAFVRVYSLRNKTWKCFLVDDDFPVHCEVVTGDGFIDGKFYWFAKLRWKENGPSSTGLVMFDFSAETLKLIPLLSGTLASAWDSVAVTTRGCLEVIATYMTSMEEGRMCEVWGMEEDGSWSNKLKVSLPVNARKPLGVMKDGQLIYSSLYNIGGYEILLVNPSTGSIKNIGHGSLEFWVFTYVESFFSINQ